MRSWILTSLLAVVAMSTGFANAHPMKNEDSMPPEVMEILAKQICSSRNIPDCHSRAKDCISLMESISGSDVPNCPGLDSTQCMMKINECLEIISGVEGAISEPEPEGGDASMMREMLLEAGLLCSFSYEEPLPLCREDVMSCLKLEKQLIEGSPHMPPQPCPSMCANVNIPDCETKVMTCGEKIVALANIMHSSMSSEETSSMSSEDYFSVSSEENSQEEMTMEEEFAVTPETTAMIMCRGSEEPDCEEKVVDCLVLSKNVIESMGTPADSEDTIFCGSDDMADCMTKMKECNVLTETLTRNLDSMDGNNMALGMLQGRTRVVKFRAGLGNGRRKNGRKERTEGKETK